MKTLYKELSLFIAAVSISNSAFADAPLYTLTDLGVITPLQGASNYGIGSASSSGTVAGSSDANADAVVRAFYFNGISHELGTLGGSSSYGTGMNGSNVVGYADTINNAQHAFFYNGTMRDIGTLGGANSRAYGINSNSHIVGEAEDVNGDSHAFFYNGVMHDLGTLGGTYSTANAINNNGVIVGHAAISDNAEDHAFIYDGSMHDMGTLGGITSNATGISSNGLAVGSSWLTGDAVAHAFLYDGAIHDLGTLGGDFSEAVSVNSSGWAVGWSHTNPGDSLSSIFLYDGTQMYDLNVLLANVSFGIGISQVISISDTGEILAMGYDINNEEAPYDHLFRLNLAPVPVPASAWLFGSSVIGLIGFRRKSKNS